MKPWADYHALVMPWVIGCPIPTVDAALVRAARKFCEGTRAWTEKTEATATGATDLFDFDMPTSSEIVRVVAAKVGELDYDDKVFDRLPSTWPEEEAPAGIYMAPEGQFVVSPMPIPGTNLILEVAFKPKLSAQSAGDVLFDSYGEDIAAGALSELLKMPQPWANPALAVDYGRTFTAAIHKAANRGFATSGAAGRRVTIVE